VTTNPTPQTANGKVQRQAKRRMVPLDQIKVNEQAQRELNPSWVDYLVAHADLEQLGLPTVNWRDGSWWCVDGQHRIAMLRELGFTDEKIECHAYENLTSEQEAEVFLKLNTTLTVAALPKFRAAVHAGRPVEADIDRIVRSVNLIVTADQVPGAVRAVGTLGRVYSRGPGVLARSLRIIRDAYGDGGLEARVIDGMGHVCARYNGDLNEEEAILKLGKAHGGVNGVLNKAETLRRQTGNQKAHCVAAAIVDTINSGRGGKKLPSWWKADA
jgi:hypothetical protein